MFSAFIEDIVIYLLYGNTFQSFFTYLTWTLFEKFQAIPECYYTILTSLLFDSGARGVPLLPPSPTFAFFSSKIQLSRNKRKEGLLQSTERGWRGNKRECLSFWLLCYNYYTGTAHTRKRRKKTDKPTFPQLLLPVAAIYSALSFFPSFLPTLKPEKEGGGLFQKGDEEQ